MGNVEFLVWLIGTGVGALRLDLWRGSRGSFSIDRYGADPLDTLVYVAYEIERSTGQLMLDLVFADDVCIRSLTVGGQECWWKPEPFEEKT